MFEGKHFDHIYLAAGYTDMRSGVNSLASIVNDVFQKDPFENSLYLFCGRRADRFKALYWEDSGFVLCYKRLETGRFRWPRGEHELITITEQQLRWLLEGLKIDQVGVIPSLYAPQII